MGLDFRWQGCRLPFDEIVHFSYRGFHVFREEIAKRVGVENLDSMAGFCRSGDGMPWTDIPAKDNPIVLLLNHSDCDGELTPQQCEKIAPVLREIMNELPQESWIVKNGLLLASHMEECARLNVSMEFC